MAEDLLKCLYSYKVNMDYKDKDFDGDRVQQYAVLKVKMPKSMFRKVLDHQRHIFYMMRK